MLVLVVGLGGLMAAGVAWGRPQLRWHLRTSDNTLELSVARGRGPLANWLFSGAFASVGSRRGHRLVLSVQPDRTARVTASMWSMWTSTVQVVVRVPPRPALLAATVASGTLTLRFTLPVRIENTSCGVPPPASPVRSVVVSRGTTSCAGTFHLVAASGERAAVSFVVPALPPPPPPPLPPPPAPSSIPAPTVYFGPQDGGAYYITIDDGSYPDPQVLALMQQTHVPITAFLVSNIAASHLDYWRSFVAAGGDIEDHTVSHPNLTMLSLSNAEAQWADAAHALRQWFGPTPTLGRPPGGSVNTTVRVAASEAALRYVVLWSASMYNGQLTTYDNKPLRAGEIVILHWIPGLYDSLVRLLAIGAAEGLHPAPLASSLGT